MKPRLNVRVTTTVIKRALLGGYYSHATDWVDGVAIRREYLWIFDPEDAS